MTNGDLLRSSRRRIIAIVEWRIYRKYFFSSALNTTSGEDASARAIKAKLEKMVGDEDDAKPLTDQQIVHLFQEQGIQIARRTVAKYRDQLGILPARMRKRV